MDEHPNVKISISAPDRVGTMSLTHNGELVVVHDGAVVPKAAWETARATDQLRGHFARGRIVAVPTSDPVTPIPTKVAPEESLPPTPPAPAPAPAARTTRPKGR